MGPERPVPSCPGIELSRT